MPILHLEIVIRAPVERCFDLSRSIDLHMVSAERTGEQAIAGVTTGLIGLDEEVTWRARHFGVRMRHTSRISAFDRPRHFRDEMVRGAFARFVHDHRFEEAGDGATRIVETLDFASPLGPLGALVDRLVLARYLTEFLQERNAVIKRVAESNEWRRFLPG